MRKFLSKFDLGSTESNSLEIPMGRRRASKHRSAFKGGTHFARSQDSCLRLRDRGDLISGTGCRVCRPVRNFDKCEPMCRIGPPECR